MVLSHRLLLGLESPLKLHLYTPAERVPGSENEHVTHFSLSLFRAVGSPHLRITMQIYHLCAGFSQCAGYSQCEYTITATQYESTSSFP